MKPEHRQVLQGLADMTRPDSDEDGAWYASFKLISRHSGVPDLKQVRRIVRRLARQGFAEFRNGLMSEEGEVAGSGYAITDAGLKKLDEV